MPVGAQKNVRKAAVPAATRKVKFLRDTIHPEYGNVEKGEVLRVLRAYLDDYEELGIAEETDDELSRPLILPES